MMNPNMIPPVPPNHFPPNPHGGPPRVLHNPPPPRPIDPMPGGVRFSGQNAAEGDILAQMAKLNMNGNGPMRPKGTSEQGVLPKGLPPLDSSATAPVYEGWTFYRADSDLLNQKPNWSRATKLKMNLSQSDLSNMVQKRKKKAAIAEQYQDLGRFKRAHVDRLIEDRKKEDKDTRFDWTCVYVDVVNKAARGRGARFGDFETISMDVIIMRKVQPDAFLKSSTKTAFGELVDLHALPKPKDKSQSKSDNHRAEPDPRSMKAVPGNGQQFMQGFNQGGPSPGMVNVVQQPMHPQPPPNQGNMMGGQRPPGVPGQQGAMPTGNQAPGFPGAMHGGMGAAGPRGHPGIGGPYSGAPFPPGGPGPFHPSQGTGRPHSQPQLHPHPPPHPHPPLAPFPDDFKNENKARQGAAGPKILNAGRPAKSPKLRPTALEAEWPPENSSVEDDESLLFELNEDSSATEDSFDEYEKVQLPRAGLRPQRRSSKHGRNEQVYRSHSRKQPSKSAYPGDRRRKSYLDEPVDIMPENSLHARREPRRRQTTDTVALARPRVTYNDRDDIRDSMLAVSQVSPITAERAYMEMLRDQEQRMRAMEHITSRRLQEREDLLRLREEDLEYREMEIDDRDRFNGGRHLMNRRLSLRERPRYHRSGYRSRDDLY